VSSRESATTAPVKGSHHAKAGGAALTLAALGVVFGDIGTSPLYSIQTIFSADNHIVSATQANVYGVISLVFWAITMIVSVKYVTFITRAHNNGEGGEMALISLIQRHTLKRHWAKALLIALGICGASLFFGDGMITPAISVLSAVEGLKVVSPNLGHLIVPITLVIITTLFMIQRYGTGLVGRLFGPIMCVWFGVLAAGGVSHVSRHPEIIKALSPVYGVQFFFRNGLVAFIALASVVLVVTGAEALYADMGHFGRPPIKRAWFFVVFPALTLNYLGQGSLILHSPQAASGTFFLLYPHWAAIPLVILATVATVIASQALITGAFSVTRQAVQLGFLPRLRILHTSEKEQGQVYVPSINWMLYTGIVIIVLGFGSSARLASAYGFAVTGTFIVSTTLFLFVIRVVWEKPLWMAVAAGSIFFPIDLAFFGANIRKVLGGGWLPLFIAIIAFTVLMTWQRGRDIVTRNRTEQEGSLREFIECIHRNEPPIFRVPGTAIFLNANSETAPLAMRANVEHNHTLHQSVVIVSVDVKPIPHVEEEDRLSIDDLGYLDDGITHITIHYGFSDSPDIPAALTLAAGKIKECDVDVEGCSYFLSRINIVRTNAPGMHSWRKKLFVAVARQAANPVEYFGLPADRTVIMGGHINV
jgi:KUP system potassium uptake protein